MQPKHLHITRRCLRVNRKQIALLKFILEGYDNMATLTTLDAAIGTVVLRIAAGCEADIAQLLFHLQDTVFMEQQDDADAGRLKETPT